MSEYRPDQKMIWKYTGIANGVEVVDQERLITLVRPDWRFGDGRWLAVDERSLTFIDVDPAECTFAE